MKFDAGRCSDAYEKLEPEADRLLPENLEDFLVELRARTGNSESRRPSGLRKTNPHYNSLAHRTTWLRSDLEQMMFLKR